MVGTGRGGAGELGRVTGVVAATGGGVAGEAVTVGAVRGTRAGTEQRQQPRMPGFHWTWYCGLARPRRERAAGRPVIGHLPVDDVERLEPDDADDVRVRAGSSWNICVIHGAISPLTLVAPVSVMTSGLLVNVRRSAMVSSKVWSNDL